MLNGFNALVQYCEQAMYVKSQRRTESAVNFSRRCRHLVICKYFGETLATPCETMCDVCTQRELVSVHLQNLKVNLSWCRDRRESFAFRRSNSMTWPIDGRTIESSIETKAVKNSTKEDGKPIVATNVTITIRTRTIDARTTRVSRRNWPRN